MKYTNLGKTGLKISPICLGMMTYGSPKWRDWVLDEDAARPFVKRALEAGINFFDTADVNSVGASEEVTGKLLKEMAQRDKLVIATKVCNPMSSDANDRGLSRASTLCKASTPRCGGSGRTTSTSTKFIAGTRSRRSKRRWRR